MVATRKFLIADQALAVTRRTRRHLEHAGVSSDRILESFTAAGALDLFREHRPSVVLVGIELPDRGGHELAQDIWYIDPTARVVVFTAASRDDPRVRQAREAGAAAVVEKPVHESDVRDLMEIIGKAAGRERIPPSR